MNSALGSPNLRAHTLIQRNVSDIKQRLEGVRTEAVTGRAHDVARAVNGDTGKLARLTDAMDYAKGRESVLTFEGDRMTTAQHSISAMREQSEAVRDALLSVAATDSPVAKDVAEQAALGGLTDTVARLNGSFGGRPLFGGDSGLSPLGDASEILDAMRGIIAAAPDTATALTDIDAWFDDPAGGFATALYQGGDGDAPRVEVAKGERITTSARADEPAFRDLLKGLAVTALAAEATDDSQRDALLDRGTGVLQNAIEGAVSIQASLGVSEERAANALAEQATQVSTLSIAYNGLTGRDQAEAATEMRLLESQLEAAYLTTSRMANLSLLNYLR